jgi:hypothetical protein
MDEGFLVDRRRKRNDLPIWVEGEPVRWFWGSLKLRGRVRYHATTRRCGKCGYLESFALDRIG